MMMMIYINTYTNINTHTYTHTHTHIYIYIPTYTHAYDRACVRDTLTMVAGCDKYIEKMILIAHGVRNHFVVTEFSFASFSFFY